MIALSRCSVPGNVCLREHRRELMTGGGQSGFVAPLKEGDIVQQRSRSAANRKDATRRRVRVACLRWRVVTRSSGKGRWWRLRVVSEPVALCPIDPESICLLCRFPNPTLSKAFSLPHFKVGLCICDSMALQQRHMTWTAQRNTGQLSIPIGTRGDKKC